MKRYLLAITLVAAQLLLPVTNCPAQWTQVLGSDSSWWGNYVLSFAVSGHKVFAGTENHQVFFSSDDGATWSLASDTTQLDGIWSLATIDSNLFAGTSLGVFRSTDNGRVWMPLNVGIKSGGTGVIGWALAAKPAIQPGGTSDLFLGSTENGAFLSTDVGASWTPIDSGLTSLGIGSLLVRGQTIWASAGYKGVFLSTNNGTNWTAFSNGLPSSSGIWALASGGSYLFAGFAYNYGVYRSSNDGASWSWANSGITDMSVRSLVAFGPNVVAATVEGGVFLSTNSGASWSSIDDGLPELWTWSLLLKGAYLYVGTEDYGIWRRSLKDLNIPERWKLASLPVSVTDFRATTVFPEAVSSPFSYDGISYRSADTILNGLGYWVRISGDSVTPASGTPIMQDTIDVQTGWNLVGSIDTTIGVSSIMSIPGGLVTSEFYAYDSSYVVADSIRPGLGYWVKVSEAGQLIFSSTSSIAAHNLINVVPRGELPPPVPGAGAIEKGILPTSYALGQNYPNPFNPTTRISYSLPEASRITVKIFNLLGQTIATLVEGEQPAGEYSVAWNADGLASGLYFYRLEARSVGKTGGTYTQTRKLLLMK